MPLELAKETMVWREEAGRQASQILLEGDVIVPDSKPDLQELLRCEGSVKIRDKRVSDDRIGFSGELELLVLYAGKNGEQPLYTMKSSLPMEDFIHMDGLEPDMEITLDANLEHLDCEIINDRKLSVKAVVGVEAAAERRRSAEILCDAEGEGVECLKGCLCMEADTAELRDRFTIKEELVLPAAKPEISEILWEGTALTEQDVRPMDGKVMVRGNLKISILYTDTQGNLGSFTEKIPFSGYLEGDEIEPRSVIDTRLWIEEAKLTPTIDEDGETRQISADVTVGAALKGREPVEHEILLDAYSPKGTVKIDRETVTYPLTVASGKNQFTLKERVQLENGESPMLRVEEIWGDVRLEEARTGQDFVEAEGVLSAAVLYYCENDESPVCVIRRGYPFNQTVELKGVQEGDTAEIELRLEDLDFQILSEREGELRATLAMETHVQRKETAETVTDITLEENAEEQISAASAVIYMVQPGDSLWSIAKNYHTTMEDILAVNEIENPDLLYPGQKLLIIKILR